MIECKRNAFEVKHEAFYHNQIKICTFDPIICFPSKQSIFKQVVRSHHSISTFAVALLRKIFPVFFLLRQSRREANGLDEFLSVYLYWFAIHRDVIDKLQCRESHEQVRYEDRACLPIFYKHFSLNTSRERICICIFRY